MYKKLCVLVIATSNNVKQEATLRTLRPLREKLTSE
jgi:hypothetical protein